MYRKPGGESVAMEDQCPHRQAALSLGRKEGDSLRCMYHGLKFGPNRKCTEIPGQDRMALNLSPSSLRGAAGDVAIQWASLSVRGSRTALRAGFMTGLPRSARNDERGEGVQLRLS